MNRFREFFLVKVSTIIFYDILSNCFYGGIISVFVYLMDIGGFDLIAYSSRCMFVPVHFH